MVGLRDRRSGLPIRDQIYLFLDVIHYLLVIDETKKNKGDFLLPRLGFKNFDKNKVHFVGTSQSDFSSTHYVLNIVDFVKKITLKDPHLLSMRNPYRV